MVEKNKLISNNKLILALISVLALTYLLILIFEIQLSKLIRGYFWHSMHIFEIELPLFWLIFPLIILGGLAAAFVFKSTGNFGWKLLVLVILGYAMQLSFGFMEGRGIAGVRDRMVTAGHSEFARLAATNDDIIMVAVHYESLLKSSPNSAKYVHTKPPGQLLFYMLTQKISNAFSPIADPKARFDRLTTFASYTFPLISGIVLIPLFGFARLFTSSELAVRACLLYIFVPSITLTTLHLDQVLYPFLAMMTLFLVTSACRQKWLLYSLSGGACLYLALFVSFSLVPLILLAVLSAIIYCRAEKSDQKRFLRIFRIIGGVLIGFLIMYMIGRIALDYNPWVRFNNAMLYHEQWKGWSTDAGSIMLYSLLNIIEYACWLGLPAAVMLGAAMVWSIRRTIAGEYSALTLLCLSLAVVILITMIFGKTKGEVARIWIFFIPLSCLLSIHSLQRLFRSKTDRVLSLLLGLQFFIILAIKKYQDFY